MRDIKKVEYNVSVNWQDYYFEDGFKAFAFAQAAFEAVEDKNDKPRIQISFIVESEDEENDN